MPIDGAFFERVNGAPAGGAVELTDVVTTLFDIDWTAESAQDFLAGGDGTYTLDAEPDIEIVDTASATQFEIQNGTGLVLASLGGDAGELDQGPGAPFVGIKLDPYLSKSRGTFVPWTYWFHVSSYSLPDSLNAWLGGFYGPVGGNYSSTMYGGGVRNNSGSLFGFLRAHSGWEHMSTINSPPTINAQAVNVFAVRHAQGYGCDVYAGVWDGGWPAENAMQLVGLYRAQNTSDSHVMLRPGAQAFWGVETDGAVNPGTATLAHSKLVLG